MHNRNGFVKSCRICEYAGYSYLRMEHGLLLKKKGKLKHCGSAFRGDFSKNFRHQLYIM